MRTSARASATSLALAAAQADATFADHGVEGVRQLAHEVGRGGHLERRPQLTVGELATHSDVVGDAATEQEGLLEHDRAVARRELHPAGGRSDQAGDEHCQRRFARPGRADQRRDRTGGYDEVDRVERRELLAEVHVRHTVQFDTDTGRGERDRVGRVRFERLLGHRADPRPGGDRSGQFRQRVTDEPQRQDEQGEEEDGTRELADRQVVRPDPRRADHHEQDVGERRDHVEEPLEPAADPDGLEPLSPHPLGEAGEPIGLAFLGAIRLDELHAFEALVDAGRELTELVLRPRVVRRHGAVRR